MATNLSDEILCIVFSFLTLPELGRASGVCKDWHRVALDERLELGAISETVRYIRRSKSGTHSDKLRQMMAMVTRVSQIREDLRVAICAGDVPRVLHLLPLLKIEGVFASHDSIEMDGLSLLPIHLAARRKQLHVLQALVVKGVSVHRRDCSGVTALYHAIDVGWVEGVHWILENHSDVQCDIMPQPKGNLFMSSLELAMSDTRILGAILDRVDDGQIERRIWDAFARAVRFKRCTSPLEVAKLLEGRGIQWRHAMFVMYVAHVWTYANAAQYCASADLEVEFMRFLVELGVNINPKDARARAPVTPLSIAIERGNIALVEYLWDLTEDKEECVEHFSTASTSPEVNAFLVKKGIRQ